MRNQQVRAAGLLSVVLFSAVLSMAGLVGCTESEPEGSGNPAVTSPEQQLLALGREYSQCVRDNGVPAYPDMIVVDGRLTLPDDATGDAGEQALRANPAARDACQAILQRLPADARKDPALTPEDRANLVKFAACMRANGVPEWPDPDADGTFPISGTALETETKSARMQAATQACRQHWDKGLPIK